jgi:Sulfotransferase family
MADSPVKVLFIMGTGRSGSTLVDCLLGQSEGFFSGGELSHIWLDGLIRRRACGCGKALPECEVWNRILEHAYGPGAPIDAHEAQRLQEHTMRSKNLVRLLRAGPGGTGWDELAAYIRMADSLYPAIARATGARVVVDSSKRPQQAALLRLLPSVDAYLVHLVRDPRAVAYSMQRHNLLQPHSNTDPAAMATSSPAKSARLWVKWNLFGELVRARYGSSRTISIRYEDIVDKPLDALAAIARLVGEPFQADGFSGERSLDMSGNHTAWGNPSRFKTGPTEIRNSDSSPHRLPPAQKATVTGLTLPLLFRYGYRLSPGSAGRE